MKNTKSKTKVIKYVLGTLFAVCICFVTVKAQALAAATYGYESLTGEIILPGDTVAFSHDTNAFLRYNDGIGAVSEFPNASNTFSNFMLSDRLIETYAKRAADSSIFKYPAGKSESDFEGWQVYSDDTNGSKRTLLILTAVWKASEGPSDESSEASASSSSGCQHEYSWYTVIKATPETDGKKAYQCRKCDKVSGHMTVSGYDAFIEETAVKLSKAASGTEQTINTKLWHSFPKSVYEAIQAKPDVSVTINFTYKKTDYTVTIPAGADVLSLVDENGYCGFLKLNEVFGGRIVQ